MMLFHAKKWLYLATLLALSLPLISCTAVGSKMISPGRVNYSRALSESNNEQILLNVARLHYLETPTFVQVSSITAQNSLQAQAGVTWLWPNNIGDSSYLSPSASYAETPTISYIPLQGADFTKRLLAPLSLEALYYLCLSDWDIGSIFELSVQAIGTAHNKTNLILTDGNDEDNPRYQNFIQIIHLLRKLQHRDKLCFIYKSDKDKNSELILKLNDTPEVAKINHELKQRLGISQNTNTIHLVTDPTAKGNDTVRIITRSFMQVMGHLADSIQPAPLSPTTPCRTPQDFQTHIYVADIIPNSHCKVFYRKQWYYIDDTDTVSKQNFILVNTFYELSAGEAGGMGPVYSLNLGK